MNPSTQGETLISQHQYIWGVHDSMPSRLNIQHTYIKTTVYEGLLIFDESVKLSLDSALLDSGTGTGDEAPPTWPYDYIIANHDQTRCMDSGSCE